MIKGGFLLAHVFNSQNKHKLDNPERRKLLPPEQTVAQFTIKEGQVVADIGCGIGYFTLPIAKAVGETGRVLALDVQPSMVKATSERMAEAGLKHVETSLSEPDSLPLQDQQVDGVFLSMILHEVPDLAEFLAEVHRVLKSGGQIMIIEWKKEETSFGPPVEERLEQQALADYLAEAGWQQVTIKTINDTVYGMEAVK